MENLATELAVSKRTIRRDIEILSAFYPIYTQPGKYNGGIYVMEGFSMERMYMSDAAEMGFEPHDLRVITTRRRRRIVVFSLRKARSNTPCFMRSHFAKMILNPFYSFAQRATLVGIIRRAER
jgi:hypothetical protein